MIYIVRHGQTDWNLVPRIQGQLDIPLNEQGRREAVISAKQIASLKIDQIISSDLSRAKETATIINDFISAPIHYDPRLREAVFGDLQGILVKDISEEAWRARKYEPHKIHAESYAELYERVKSFFSEIDETKNTLIVTHAGVVKIIKYLSQHPNSFDLKEFEETAMQFKIKNTAVFTWDKSEKFQSLVNEQWEKSNCLEF
ncbi:MAG: histidine phosphatase family protein [Alphaproteobacteria bacterium]|nr:histidine phosphatase family protein [Alphaproteobacteria bacterium]